MGSFLFGSGSGKVSMSRARKADRIAQRHGARCIVADLPEGARYWFTAPNMGDPFDKATAKAVLEDLEAAGLVPLCAPRKAAK